MYVLCAHPYRTYIVPVVRIANAVKSDHMGWYLRSVHMVVMYTVVHTIYMQGYSIPAPGDRLCFFFWCLQKTERSLDKYVIVGHEQ